MDVSISVVPCVGVGTYISIAGIGFGIGISIGAVLVLVLVIVIDLIFCRAVGKTCLLICYTTNEIGRAHV